MEEECMDYLSLSHNYLWVSSFPATSGGGGELGEKSLYTLISALWISMMEYHLLNVRKRGFSPGGGGNYLRAKNITIRQPFIQEKHFSKSGNTKGTFQQNNQDTGSLWKFADDDEFTWKKQMSGMLLAFPALWVARLSPVLCLKKIWERRKGRITNMCKSPGPIDYLLMK